MKATENSPQYYETIEGRYTKNRKDRLVSLDERQAHKEMIRYGSVENYLVKRHQYNPEEESYSIHRNEAQNRIEYVISKYEYVKIEDKGPEIKPPLGWKLNPQWQDFIEDKDKLIAEIQNDKQFNIEPPTELCFFKQSDL